MTPGTAPPASIPGLEPRVTPPEATFVVARGAGHDPGALRRAEELGATVGAAVRVSHRRLEVGPGRGPLDRRPRLALEDLLDRTRPGTRLMLDLRGHDPRLPRLLAGALDAASAAPLLLCSPTWWLLDAFRGQPGRHVAPVVASARQLAVLLRRCDTEPLDGVAIDARLLTPGTAAALRAMTPMLLAWPVDSASEARRLGHLGVTGLISDHPAALLPPAALAA